MVLKEAMQSKSRDLKFQQAKNILCKQNKSAKNLEKTQQQKSKDVGKPKSFLVSKNNDPRATLPNMKDQNINNLQASKIELRPKKKLKCQTITLDHQNGAWENSYPFFPT